MEFEVLTKLADEIIDGQQLVPADVWDPVSGRIQLRPEVAEIIVRLVTSGTRITWSDIRLINRTMDVRIHGSRVVPETMIRLHAPNPYADVALRLAITVAERVQRAAMRRFAPFADGMMIDLGLQPEAVRDSDGRIVAASVVDAVAEVILAGVRFNVRELQVLRWNFYPRLNGFISQSTRKALKQVPVRHGRAVRGLMLYVVFRAEGIE